MNPLLKERVLSAVFLVPIVLSAFYLGKTWFVLFLSILALGGSLEYRKIMKMADIDLEIAFVPIACLVALSGVFGRSSIFVSILLVGSLTILSVSMRKGAQSAMFALGGVTYIGGLLGSLGLLRMAKDGQKWALFVLLVTWATDVGAYFGGRLFGSKKLAPTISPGKSWEGAMAGVFSAGLAGLIMAGVFRLPIIFGIVSGFVLGILAELGDLTESVLKRFAKVKDSGHLIPGHGGILDRFDSLLFTSVGGLVIKAIYRLLF